MEKGVKMKNGLLCPSCARYINALMKCVVWALGSGTRHPKPAYGTLGFCGGLECRGLPAESQWTSMLVGVPG